MMPSNVIASMRYYLLVLVVIAITQLDSLYVQGQPNNVHVRSVSGKMNLQKVNCILSQCSGKSGSSLEVCSLQCDQNDVTKRSVHDVTRRAAPCHAPQCREFSGVYKDLCEFTKCTLQQVTEPREEKRYNFNEMIWPDDMETRSSEAHARVRSRRGSEEVEEASLERSRKDAEQGRPVHAQGCSTTCHGFSGSAYEECMATQCNDASRAHIAVDKRWSTRLCMETHCQGVNSKVDYFMCGKLNCH